MHAEYCRTLNSQESCNHQKDNPAQSSAYTYAKTINIYLSIYIHTYYTHTHMESSMHKYRDGQREDGSTEGSCRLKR